MSLENFMSSHSSKNGAGFVETARLIAGENPARWLVKHLRDWSPCIMLDGSVHARQPGKAEARRRLKKLINAIEIIDREIRDAVVFELLLAQEFGPLPTNTSMDAVLREIHRRAELASSRLNLLATGLDERLEQLSDGAKLVTRELQDCAVSEFLRAEQRGSPPENVEFGTALIEIKRQAESALLSDYLATKTGKTRAGRGRALPPNAGLAGSAFLPIEPKQLSVDSHDERACRHEACPNGRRHQEAGTEGYTGRH
ncbi:MAG TPA: hypothetical protein VNZ53_47915, partial [Steroidobacteraceae bacterium]|nr:hypothetical protein [Steroidobacteraceae bacterium]